MKEFMLLFRADYKNMQSRSPEEWQEMAKKWKDWIAGLSAQNKWVAAGKQLSQNGKVVRPNGVTTDGPFVELKESVNSYCIIKADSLEDAAELSKNCPILTVGGTVEIRGMAAS